MPRQLAAIMFTDISGFTSFAHRDESGALRLVEEQEALLSALLQTHHGRKVKSMGDGLLLEFPNTLDAIECGVELQRRVHDRNASKEGAPLRLRLGLHLGDIQRRGSDILGDAVNIASRIQSISEPGGLYLSFPVYDQVHNKVSLNFEKLGMKSLKGVQDPVEIYRVVFPWSSPDAVPGGPLPARVAVLPLANTSPDPNDTYFAEGLTDELITVLSQIKGLRVISRTSVNQYKGTAKPAPQIGAELGADTILEGSVRKAGNRLRIALQLVDARTDEHRWAQTYDQELKDVFAIQADVAKRTANALKVELLAEERKTMHEKPTSSLIAYEAYLRGLQASRQATELVVGPLSDRLEGEAVRCFETAIREDPQFSAVYAALATHLVARMGFNHPNKDDLPRIRALVDKALELDPGSGDAHLAQANLAMQGDLDWARAEAEFQEAIALNPSNSSAHNWYGYLLIALQRFEEARKQFLAATELDPLWLTPRLNLTVVEMQNGDVNSSLAAREAVWKSHDENLVARSLLAWGYAYASRAGDAVKLVEPLKGATDLDSRCIRSEILAVSGRPGELRDLLSDTLNGRVAGYVSQATLALFHALLGEDERALALLEQDYRKGDRTLWAFYQSVSFDRIREDPRFVALLSAMKLPTTLSRRWRLSV